MAPRIVKPEMLKAVKILEDAGLVFVSTPRQLENGTLMFDDPKIKGVKYSVTANGYARRHVTGKSYWSGQDKEDSYPLNKKRKPQERGRDDVSVHLSPGDYEGLAKIIVNRLMKPGRFSHATAQTTSAPSSKAMAVNSTRAKSVEDYDLPDWVNDNNADSNSMREFAGMIKDALDYADGAGMKYNVIVDLIDQELAEMKEDYKY